MVVVHVKGEEEEEEEEGGEHQFLYECPTNRSIDEITDDISEISTLQSKIQTLSLSLKNTILTDSFKENCPDAALALERTLSEADTYASKDQVIYKRALSPHILKDHIHIIEKEIKASPFDSLFNSNIQQLFLFPEHSTLEYTQLWWAGKQLRRGKKLSEYIGDNEKTKILVKLKSARSGT